MTGLSCDVLVVGGGPAGASVSAALARAGVDVLVVDRARFPRPKPCAEYLSPEASRILASMGALDRVEQSGAAALDGIVVRAPNGREIRGTFVAAHGFRGYRDRGLSVRREVLDWILLDSARAAGARVVERARVTDLVRGPGGEVIGAECLRQDREGPTPIAARLVIGADGLRSVVARRLGLARTARWPRRMALVTHYRSVAGVGDRAEMHVERDGYVGIADVGQGVTTVALVVPAARVRGGGDMTAVLTAWIAGHAHLAPRFAAAERVSPVVATGPFAARARRAAVPGAILVGDAADFFDPFTGEGIYAALRGGELAAESAVAYLAANREGERRRVCDAYEAARRTAFGGKWTVERIIGTVVAHPILINRAARGLSARPDLADLLVGVTGNFIPASTILTWRYLRSAFAMP